MRNYRKPLVRQGKNSIFHWTLSHGEIFNKINCIYEIVEVYFDIELLLLRENLAIHLE